MKFCVPLILGIILGWKYVIPLGFAIGLLAILLVLVGVMQFWRRASAIIPSIVFVVVILFGVVKITFDARMRTSDNVSNFVTPDRTVTLVGTVSDQLKAGPRAVRFIVDADSVRIGKRSFKASGGVSVSVRNEDIDAKLFDSLTYGRTVKLQGDLVDVALARNPGEFDLRRYLLINNVFARFYAERLDSMSVGSKANNNFLASFVYPVRRSITERIDRFIGGEEAKFLKGVVVGERSAIPAEVKAAFINSGVMHILAVSGLHVAIVTFMIVIFLQTIRLPEKLRIVCTSLLLIYYIFLTGSAPSVIRAVTMAIVFLGARLFERRSDMYNTLAFAAILLLLYDAKQLFMPGFQLSFVAVLSLVYLYPKIYGLKKFLPERVRTNRVVGWLVAGFAVSMAAGIGTLPFTSLYFGKISLVSFLANLIVVPLANLILALGMVTISVSYISSWLASVYASLASFLTWLLLTMVAFLGGLPFAYTDSHFSGWSSLVFYGSVGFVVNIFRKEFRKPLLIGALIGLNVWMYWFLILGGSTDPLRATFLDVGQGDAMFLEFPDGSNMLVDAGPRTFATDAGARFIASFLQSKSINRINTVVLSHPHSDHVGGLPFLFRQVKVDQVIDAGSADTTEVFAEYRRLIDSLHIQYRQVCGGAVVDAFRDGRVYILHPSGEFLPTDSIHFSNLNNQSVVLKVCYGQKSVLLCGDAEKEAEARMAATYGSFLASDVLKVGHHGSITSTTARFYRNVHPMFAIVSVGAKNRFHHPSPVVLDRLRMGGTTYFRTDQTGAIVFESDGKSWSRVDWR